MSRLRRPPLRFRGGYALSCCSYLGYAVTRGSHAHVCACVRDGAMAMRALMLVTACDGMQRNGVTQVTSMGYRVTAAKPRRNRAALARPSFPSLPDERETMELEMAEGLGGTKAAGQRQATPHPPMGPSTEALRTGNSTPVRALVGGSGQSPVIGPQWGFSWL